VVRAFNAAPSRDVSEARRPAVVEWSREILEAFGIVNSRRRGARRRWRRWSRSPRRGYDRPRVAPFGEADAGFGAGSNSFWNIGGVAAASRENYRRISGPGAGRGLRRQRLLIGRGQAPARSARRDREPSRRLPPIGCFADRERGAAELLVRRPHPSVGGSQRGVFVAARQKGADALPRPPDGLAARQEKRNIGDRALLA